MHLRLSGTYESWVVQVDRTAKNGLVVKDVKSIILDEVSNFNRRKSEF